jgi:hypothetical protein
MNATSLFTKALVRLRAVEPSTWVAIVLIVAGISLRLVPHPANFAPVGAIALFGGAVLSARTALWLPLAIMAVSDVLIGFHGTMLFTWGGFALVGMLGMLLSNYRNLERIPLGALGSAIIFYVVSNFGVWVEGKLYMHTFQGLVDCYVAALPFLRNSLIADLVFASVLFGAYALANTYFVKKLALKPVK